MLEIQKVKTADDIHIFSSLKIKLIQYHLKYADVQGINDAEVTAYNYECACKHIEDRESFLLKLDKSVVGILQVEKQISKIDNEPILYVHALYFREQYRDKGLGIYVLKYLCKIYKLRIECSCWYDIPASKLYEKIGFKTMYTRYFLPLNNNFYDSDQN